MLFLPQLPASKICLKNSYYATPKVRCNFIIQIHKFTIKIETISINLLFERVKIVEFNLNSHMFLAIYQDIRFLNQDVNEDARNVPPPPAPRSVSIRSHLEFQPVVSFSVPLETELIKNGRLSSWFKKQASWLDLQNVCPETRGNWNKFYNLDTFEKQVDANCVDLDREFVDLNYKVASLIYCHFWRSISYFEEQIHWVPLDAYIF